ncbi:MAG: hypothetical protein ACXAEU_24620 [Candidatus Hodarchaeales archaeon]|jgi:hypothetical protein
MISIPHTSRHDYQDPIDVPAPRKSAYESIKAAIEMVCRNKTPKIIPVLGEAGYGKTHLYHALSRGLDARIVYLSSPSAREFYAQLYFALLRTHGMGFLTEVSNNLSKKYDTYDQAAVKYPGKGANILEIIFALNDPEFSKIARYWLTGNLNNSIFNKLNILEDEEVAFLLLKIVLEYSSKPVMFFLDELESILYQDEKSETIFLYKLKKLYNESPNFVLVLSCITQMWDRFTEISSASIQSRLDPPKMLKRFTKEDVMQFANELIKHAWTQNGLPIDLVEANTYLNDEEIEEIMLLSGGNPRETIKSLQMKLEGKWDELEAHLEAQRKNSEQEAEKLKEIIESIQMKVKNLNCGSMSQKHGYFYLLSKNKRKLLIISPYHPAASSFSEYLKNLQNDANYQQIIVFTDEVGVKQVPGIFVSTDLEDIVTFVVEWFERTPF